jgi:hypothetical protein
MLLVLHLDEILQLLHSFELKEVNTDDMTSFTSFFFFQIMGPYDLRAVQSQKTAIRVRHCTTACARCPQAFAVEMLLINVLVVVFGLELHLQHFMNGGGH